MGEAVRVFWKFISENYLGILMVGVVLYFLLYLMIGKASGLFWSFVLEGILQERAILFVKSFPQSCCITSLMK